MKLFYSEPIGVTGGTLSLEVEHYDDVAGSISAFLYAKAQFAPATTAAKSAPPAAIKLGSTATPVDAPIMYNSREDADATGTTEQATPAAEPPTTIVFVGEATVEEATDALRQFLNSGKPAAAAVKFLNGFGVQRVTDLPPEKRGEFVAALANWKDSNGEAK